MYKRLFKYLTVLGQFPNGQFPDGYFPDGLYPTDISPTDSSTKGSSPNGYFPDGHFSMNDISPNHIFLFILIFIYRWYTKKAKANEFQQKNIYNNTNNKLNTVVKLIYLQIRYSQSTFPRFLSLVLNSKTEFLDLISAGRLFQK